MAKEYSLEISEGTLAYVYFKTEKGKVTEFAVKLLSVIEGEWHEIIRYDSGHDCPHKDILDTEGEVIRKVWYDFLDNNQALTMAITDIRDNFEFYKERHRKWLKDK